MEPYRFSEGHAETGGDLIAAAFFPAPVTAFLFPDPARRAELLPPYFAAEARLAIRTGNATALGHPMRAIALWQPPDAEPPPQGVLDEVGLTAFEALLEEDEAARVDAVVAQFEAMRARNVDGPHWYLSLLGVAPSHHGQGLGTALLRHALDRIAPGDGPCYLETVDARNVSFYERLGFRVVACEAVPACHLRVWALRRD